MSAVRIVPGLDEAENGHARFGLRLEAAARQKFAFERCEEAFAHRVVVTIRNRSHRRANIGFLAAQSERKRRVLRALIGMMDHADGIALVNRHVERIDDDLLPISFAIDQPTMRRLNASRTTAR